MLVHVIDCTTLSISLTLNNFSHQMKSNYITTTHAEWFPLRESERERECTDEQYFCWSVI